MPTGYTAAVMDGKMTTLRDFAFACARAFGFLMRMRDDAADATVPDAFEPDTAWVDEELAKARAELAELRDLSDDDCAMRARQEFEAATAEEGRRRQHEEIVGGRYRLMAAQVNGWRVPTELVGLRRFMLEQLAESKRFDCASRDPEIQARFAPKLLDGETWRHERTKVLTKSIGRWEEHRAAEIARTEQANRYLRLLRESLAKAEVAAP